MENYAMIFEEVVKHYFGKPKTEIYFSGYFDSEFSRKAILFSICVKEQNCKTDLYAKEELGRLADFEYLFRHNKSNYQDEINCVEFLASKM
jgi:hypothetical protein